VIVWCSYCQHLIREVPPYTSYEISHGACSACAARFMAGVDMSADDEVALRYYRALFAAAFDGDTATCVALAAQGIEGGFGGPELLIGILQPALEEIGARWERGEVSVEDEHRFTAYCEAMVETIGVLPEPSGPLDILIVQAPGNRHEVGPRLAERVLLSRGVSARAIARELERDELIRLVERYSPAWLGISCALPQAIDGAIELTSMLRASGFTGGVMISGQAVRRNLDLPAPPGIELCRTLDEAAALIQLPAARAHFREGPRPSGESTLR
jgi:methanogenic corrinoid protein MtbC1